MHVFLKNKLKRRKSKSKEVLKQTVKEIFPQNNKQRWKDMDRCAFN